MNIRLLAIVFVASVGCTATSRSVPSDVASTTTLTTPQPVLGPSSSSQAAASSSQVPAIDRAQAPSNVTTMFVDSKRVECEGEGKTECLRVKDSPNGSWMLFYRTIEGFTFEPGYVYELRVEVTQAKGQPADSSSKKHRLVEVVSKKKAP